MYDKPELYFGAFRCISNTAKSPYSVQEVNFIYV